MNVFFLICSLLYTIILYIIFCNINQLSQINFNENIIYTTELTQLYVFEYNLSFHLNPC